MGTNIKNVRCTHRMGPRERGIVLVEFVIAVPVVIFLMLATAELGRAFYQYGALTKTVGDGARYLAGVAAPPITGVILITPQDRTITENLVVYGTPAGSGGGAPPLLPGLTTGAVTITQVDPVRVRVSVNYAYQPIFASGIPTHGSGPISSAFTMTTSVTMRAL